MTNPPPTFKAPDWPRPPLRDRVLAVVGIAAFTLLWYAQPEMRKLLLRFSAMVFFGSTLIPILVLTIWALYQTVRGRRVTAFPINWLHVGRYAVICLVAGVGGAGIVGLGLAAGTRLFDLAQDPNTSGARLLWLGLPFTFLLGGLAFWVRLRQRLLYGFTEIAVGMCVAGAQLDRDGTGVLRNTSLALAFITAAVYLVVRGMDNCHQAWSAQAPDRLTVLVKNLFSTVKRSRSS